MKKIFSFLSMSMFALAVFAQSPQKMSYQAVVRDSDNNLIKNETVGIEIRIREDGKAGPTVFAEKHSVETNENGLVSLQVGTGETILGAFDTIPWSDGSYFLQSNIDPNGGELYSISGASEILSVPYALHAQTADSVTGGLDYLEVDPYFSASVASGISYQDTAKWNNALALDELPDTSATNELQVLSISNDTLYLSDGGFVKIPFGPTDGEENDLISFDGTNWVAKSAVVQETGSSAAMNNMQPFQVVNYVIALQGIFPSRSSLEPFIAEIMLFAGNFAPRGWAYCDGQLLPIAQNTALFSLVGTLYGGDGRTTFGLPDLRGRVPIHAGNGPGLTPRSLGEKGGSETNTLNILNLPAHSHTIIYE